MRCQGHGGCRAILIVFSSRFNESYNRDRPMITRSPVCVARNAEYLRAFSELILANLFNHHRAADVTFSRKLLSLQ